VIVEKELFDFSNCPSTTVERPRPFDITVGPLIKHGGFFDSKGGECRRGRAQVSDGAIGFFKHVLLMDGRTRFASTMKESSLIWRSQKAPLSMEAARDPGRRAASSAFITRARAASVRSARARSNAWRVEVSDPLDPHTNSEAFEIKDRSILHIGAVTKRHSNLREEYCHIMDPRAGPPHRGFLADGHTQSGVEQVL